MCRPLLFYILGALDILDDLGGLDSYLCVLRRCFARFEILKQASYFSFAYSYLCVLRRYFRSLRKILKQASYFSLAYSYLCTFKMNVWQER